MIWAASTQIVYAVLRPGNPIVAIQVNHEVIIALETKIRLDCSMLISIDCYIKCLRIVWVISETVVIQN